MRREKLWSSVGTDVSTQSNIKDVMIEANLNWNVVKRDLYRRNDTPDGVKHLPNQFANVREDTGQFLGVNTSRYHIMQNEQAFSFIDSIKNFTYEKAGATTNSKKTWVVGKYTGKQIKVDNNGDVIDFYLTIVNSFDSSSGIRIMLSPIRMFCTNQLNMMSKVANFKYSLKHTATINTKLHQLSAALDGINDYTEEVQSKVDALLATKVSDQSIYDKIVSLVDFKDSDSKQTYNRKSETVTDIINLHNNTPDLQNYRNTGFGIVNAVSEYATHTEPARKTAHYKENKFLRLIENNPMVDRIMDLIAV